MDTVRRKPGRREAARADRSTQVQSTLDRARTLFAGLSKALEAEIRRLEDRQAPQAALMEAQAPWAAQADGQAPQGARGARRARRAATADEDASQAAPAETDAPKTARGRTDRASEATPKETADLVRLAQRALATVLEIEAKLMRGGDLAPDGALDLEDARAEVLRRLARLAQ